MPRLCRRHCWICRRSGDDCIDRWDGSRLIRVLVTDRTLPFAAVMRGTVDAPAFEVSSSDPAVLDAVATTFTPAPPEYADLLAADPVLGRLDARFPGIRQIRQLDLFSGGEQRLSPKLAEVLLHEVAIACAIGAL